MRLRNLIAIFFMASAINATVTRSSGYGLGEDLSWMIEDQLPYLFENPALVNRFQNKVYFEHVEGADSGGIFIPFGNSATLGIFSGTTVNNEAFNTNSFESLFHRDTNNFQFVNFGATARPQVLGLEIDLEDLEDSGKNPLLFQNADVIFGIDLGRLAVAAGIGLAFASEETEVRQALPENSNLFELMQLKKRQLEFKAGAMYDRALVFDSIDGSITFTKFYLDNMYEAAAGAQSLETGLTSDNSFDLLFNFRTVNRLSRRNWLRLHLGYGFLNRSSRAYEVSNLTTATDREDTYSRIGHQFALGAAHEIRLSKSVMVFWGSEALYKTFTNSYDGRDNITSSYTATPFKQRSFKTTIPLVLGVTSNIGQHFDLRFSIRHNIINSADNFSKTNQVRSNTQVEEVDQATVTTQTNFLTSASNISMGFSYHLGNFSFDWLGNIQIFKDGPHFISGKENALATAFAVTFNFSDVVSEISNPRRKKKRRKRR